MTCTRSIGTIVSLAQDFLEATTRKVGTNEAGVYDILKQVHDSGCKAIFESAVFSMSDRDAIDWHRTVQPGRLNKSYVSWIIEDEFSLDTERAKAQDLWRLGHDTHRKSGFTYFAEGLMTMTDLSETGAKVMAGVGTAGAGGLIYLCAVNPLIGGVALVAVGGIGMIVAGSAILKNGIELIQANDASYKDDLHDLGNATTGFVLSAATFDAGFIFVKSTPSTFGVGPGFRPGGYDTSGTYVPPTTAQLSAAPETAISTGSATTQMSAAPAARTPAVPLIQEATEIIFHQQAGDSTAATNVFHFKLVTRTGEVQTAFADWHTGRAFVAVGDEVPAADPHYAQMLFDMLDLVAGPQRLSRTVANVPEIRKVDIIELPGYAARLWRDPPPTPPQAPATEPMN